MENTTPMLKMSTCVASLLSGTSLLKHGKVWEGFSKQCTLAKMSAGREIFSPGPVQQCCLPTYFKEHVTQMTINQTDNPNFNWQFLQLETFLNDYSANLFLDRRVKLVVLISIINAIWQIWKSLHLIRIITTHHLGINRGDQKPTSPKQTPNHNSATTVH